MTQRSEPAGFAGIEFLFWFSIVTFEAFMVPFLRGRGYSPGEIGPIMGAVFGLSVIGQPVLGAIADRVASPKRFIAGALVVAAAGVALVPLVVSWYPLVVTIALVYSVTANSLPAVLDGWIMARREQNPRINFGVARGFGSAGFAVGALTVGMIAERFGTETIFPVYVGFVLLAAGLVLQVPSRRRDEPERVTSPRSAGTGSPVQVSIALVRERVSAIVTNGPYIILLIATFFAFAGFRAALTFLPILVEQLQGSVSDVGFAHSVGAISEIPIFFLSSLIFLRWRGAGLIAILLAVLSIRIFAYTMVGTTAQLFALQLSHGLTFGLFLAATVDYIHEIAPEGHRGFFQALAPSVYFGLGSTFGSWIGGIVVERLSVVAMYRYAALLAAIGTLILAGTVVIRPRRVLQEG